MPALASVTVNDGATTPVAKTFTPTDVKSGLAAWHDRSGGVVVGYPEITSQTILPVTSGNGTSQICRVKMTIKFPVVEVVNGVSARAYDLQFKGEFLLPARSTLQDRKHILAFAKNYLAHAQVASLVQDLESIY